MKLMEAELKNRVEQTEPELSKIDMIVRLSEVRTTLEDLQQGRRKDQGIILPPEKSNRLG